MKSDNLDELLDDIGSTTLNKALMLDGDLDMPNMDEDDEYRAPDFDRLLDD